jgi:hypothetical protein
MTKTPTHEQIRDAFNSTAQAISGDMFTLCEEMGEPLKVDRDECADYIYMHGGEHAKIVSKWVMAVSYDEYTRTCDAAGVPNYWTA